ncbi:MAG: hypothetical protein EOO88_47025 [Pedobacter sp.]|nr:MAG: hypothetical protein EOO88_47025 [Pedobacter sp.]
MLEYDAAALGWLGHTMPITDRAASVLDTFYGEGIGEKPIIFIAHSLGGLVVKQILNRSATVGKETERVIAEKTCGVVFMATPHTGADIAKFVNALGSILQQTDSLKELAADAAPLRDQADWYQHQSEMLGIKTRSYFETIPTPVVNLVVDQTSANPHVTGASVVPVDANHSGIAQIASRNLPHYKSLRRFIKDSLANPT